MDEGTWSATDDGTVWVRASFGIDAICVLAFAVEVGRKDGVFEPCVSRFVVCVDERGEILERRGCLRMGWDKLCGYLVGLSMAVGYWKQINMAG